MFQPHHTEPLLHQLQTLHVLCTMYRTFCSCKVPRYSDWLNEMLHRYHWKHSGDDCWKCVQFVDVVAANKKALDVLTRMDHETVIAVSTRGESIHL